MAQLQQGQGQGQGQAKQGAADRQVVERHPEQGGGGGQIGGVHQLARLAPVQLAGGIPHQRGAGAGLTVGAAAGAAGEPIRSIISTSKRSPAARRASVTASAGAAGSAAGSWIVIR